MKCAEKYKNNNFFYHNNMFIKINTTKNTFNSVPIAIV